MRREVIAILCCAILLFTALLFLYNGFVKASTPVYVNIVLHNEEASSTTNYQDYTLNKSYYLNHREMLLRFAVMLHNHNVSFDFQSDWCFLKACYMFDNETVCINTNGKNIVQYLGEDLGVSVDPHAHETRYNYADVAYLIKRLGVKPTNIVGGFIAFPPEESVFDHFLQPITGIHYNYTWMPEILWGASTFLHTSDTPVSGVWKPKDKYDFYVHDDKQHLVYVGNYDKTFNGIVDLITKLENGQIPGNCIYTATIFVSQAVLSEEYINQFEQIVLELKNLESKGKVVLATIEETVEIWREVYGGVPNIYIKEVSSNQSIFKPVEYDEVTSQLDIRLPSEVGGSEGLFLRILYPKREEFARYHDRGSPIVIFVPGANSRGFVENSNDRLITGFGITYVYFNFPGGGIPPNRSGGVYDSRGINCQKALVDVILFSLNKKREENGFLIKDIIPHIDTSNVGVVGWSNGGNIVGVVFDLYGSILSGVKYYVGYENPAGDEYVLVDLGGRRQSNPAYIPRKTVLDPVKGSVSQLNYTYLKYNSTNKRMYFDFNDNNAFDEGIDYECGYWDYNGFRYFSTEIISNAIGKGIIHFPEPGVANLTQTIDFWNLRDMSRHYQGIEAHLTSLKGAIIFSSKIDHVQATPDYPHIIINYNGWSFLPFVRLNPDACYVEEVLRICDIETTVSLIDNDADIVVNYTNIPYMVEPETPRIEDAVYITASVLEMADRTYADNWSPNLLGVIV